MSVQKLENAVGSHQHFQGCSTGFVVHHYAGKVLHAFSPNTNTDSDTNRNCAAVLTLTLFSGIVTCTVDEVCVPCVLCAYLTVLSHYH